MEKIQELKNKIKEMREAGSEPEDISQVIQELNEELVKEARDG